MDGIHFCGILLLLTLIQISTADTFTNNHNTKPQFQTELDWKNFVETELKKNRIEMLKIWESQKNLTLVMAEFEKQNLDAISEQIAKSIQNIQNTFTAQNQEIKQSIENALTMVKHSLPNNKIEFNDHLNFIGYLDYAADLPKDCSETFDEKQPKSGIYILNLNKRGLRPFGVFCEYHEGKSWTIIQRRQDGLVDFYKNWINYKNGFGDLNSEYWLGLDRIHEMTSKRKYELWIEMETYDGEMKFARYSEFSVAGENEGYKLKVNGFSGNDEDLLTYNNNTKFTTFDNDNDGGKDFNCADDRKGAWWHDHCTLCNPNGIYGQQNGGKGIYWGSWDKPMKYFHMAIHPIS